MVCAMKKAGVLSILVVVATIAAGVTAEAQQPKKVAHIGVISPGSPASAAPVMQALREGLHDLGYVEGKNIVIEYRYGIDRSKSTPFPARCGRCANDFASAIGVCWVVYFVGIA